MNSYYHYLDLHTGQVIRINATRRPSERTKPRSKTWIVEFFNIQTHQYQMPSFPEITWGMLKSYQFMGRIKEEIQLK